MSGRLLMGLFLAFVAIFAGALIWFQYFAWYDRQTGGDVLAVDGFEIAVIDLDRIDAGTSPLKLRACFRTDPDGVAGLPRAPEAVPLTPPPWFDCFDAETLEADIDAGRIEPRLAGRDTPPGFDVVIVVYPDGRGYLWRQLGPDFAE